MGYTPAFESRSIIGRGFLKAVSVPCCISWTRFTIGSSTGKYTSPVSRMSITTLFSSVRSTRPIILASFFGDDADQAVR